MPADRDDFGIPTLSDGREPHPWQPAWRVKIGPLVESGVGILSPHVFKAKHLIEWFEVRIEPAATVIQLDLLTGEIRFDGSLQYRPPPVPAGTNFRLIWYRRMSKPMYTLDANDAAFSCLFYGVGWQATIGGVCCKQGYRIAGDGRILPGLPENAPS